MPRQTGRATTMFIPTRAWPFRRCVQICREMVRIAFSCYCILVVVSQPKKRSKKFEQNWRAELFRTGTRIRVATSDRSTHVAFLEELRCGPPVVSWTQDARAKQSASCKLVLLLQNVLQFYHSTNKMNRTFSAKFSKST